MNKTFKVNYLARDFQSIKEELQNYSKRYYGDKFSDLSESSINTLMIDAVAYVGDILSYYIDYQGNESFLQTAIEATNVTNLARSMGYKPSSTTTTTGKIALFILLPSDGAGKPDYTRSPIIKKGTTVQTSDGTRSYLITEDIIIDESLIGSQYVVARTNSVGNPTYYAVKFYAPIISGFIQESTLTIDNFIKFNKIAVPDVNAVEIISITDSEGNEYYEVSNLSQNIVYKSILNSDSANSTVKYILKPFSAQRRFVVEYDGGVPYIIFGGKQYRPDEDLEVNPVAEPSKFVLSRYNNDFLSDSNFEPNKLVNGDFFGIGPENTTLTIRHRSNSNVNNTAAIGEITIIDSINSQFLTSDISSEQESVILGSLQVINEEPILGENTELTINEIKDIAGIAYQAQNRAVTAKDYEALAYLMPPKFGSIKRVKAERDARSLKNNINLYVIATDSTDQLVAPNTQLKDNLKSWLVDFKMLTDTVDIISAKVINLGINYTLLVDPNYDKIEVYDLVQRQLQFVYSNKPQIGESFSILDFYREIRKVNGVLDIKDVQIVNKTGLIYSNLSFNIEQNTSKDGNFVLIPRNAIYEVRFPDTDIVGKVL